MVDLATLNGASLVPQISEQFQKRVGDTLQDVAEKREIEKLSGRQTPEQQQAALLRLSQLDPVLGQSVQSVLNRGDAKELAEFQKKSDEAFKFSTFLGGVKDFAQQGREIDKRIVELQQDPGDNSARIENLVKLKNMSPEKREVAILKTKTMASDAKTVLAQDKIRLDTEKAAQQKRFVNNAISAKGVRAAPAQDQPTMLEGLALQEEQNGNPDGAQAWRDIAGESNLQLRDLKLQQIEGLAATKFTPSPAIKAETEFAKINQDFRNGLITPQQFADSVTALQNKARTTLERNLTTAGVDLNTAEGKQLMIDAITKPRTVIKDSAIKLPNGFAPVNPKAWETGDFSEGIVPIKGGPQDVLKGENAGKAQMLRTAQKAAQGIDKLVFELDDKGNIILDKDGNPAIDEINLLNAWAETPGTEGRKLAKRMEFGIQAITRLETGAAMPAEELNNTRARFMPTFTDSRETVQLKLKMFQDFIGGTLKLIDPTGRFNDERFQAELDDRTTKAQKNNGPQTVGRFKIRVKN